MNRPFNLGMNLSILGVSFLVAATMVLDSVQADPATQASAAPSDFVAGPLRISVTAVQGGAQYRPDASSKWQSLKAGIELGEGVEFRTGPRGTIQFTIGTDQVFRVDRLSVVKVLRANLMPDGMIRTDVGMTYGRVSKDVDQPTRPHQDTIVTPVSTLAVRGTHVAMYDQPPYDPEAKSLTGKAFFKNLSGHQVALGSYGGGTVTVGGNSNTPTDFQLGNIQVNPQGYFGGLTPTEVQTLQTLPGTLPPTALAPPTSPFQGGQPMNNPQINPTPNVTLDSGSLTFDVDWNDSDTNSKVELVVVSPTGSVTSLASSATSGFGEDQVGFGTGFTSNGKFAEGTYTVAAGLLGTATQSGMAGQVAAGQVGASLSVNEMSTEAGSSFASGTSVVLQAVTSSDPLSSPSAVYRVVVPVTSGSVTLISGETAVGDTADFVGPTVKKAAFKTR